MQQITAAVVQGNIRRGTQEVLALLASKLDIVILSTWEGEAFADVCPEGIELVVSKKPIVPGCSHRNYQRASTAAGLRRANQLGATHVLKWRTDMLPTKLDVDQLLKWSKEDVPSGVASRYVTCAFRNLTVIEDWFSSIPDLFGFGEVSVMDLVWGDDHFDYSLDYNMPLPMLNEVGDGYLSASDDIATLYCAESELYSIFKVRLQSALARSLDHCTIAKKYMRLVNHARFGICWFGQTDGFRSITQATEHPWWSEFGWKYLSPTIVEKGYPQKGIRGYFLRVYLNPIVVRYNLIKQFLWYENYLKSRTIRRHAHRTL